MAPTTHRQRSRRLDHHGRTDDHDNGRADHHDRVEPTTTNGGADLDHDKRGADHHDDVDGGRTTTTTGVRPPQHGRSTRLDETSTSVGHSVRRRRDHVADGDRESAGNDAADNRRIVATGGPGWARVVVAGAALAISGRKRLV